MMKTKDIIKSSVFLIAGLLLFVGCTAVQPVGAQAMRGTRPAPVGNGGGMSTDGNRWIDTLPQPVTTTLTAAEADGLAFMREEEKLAHDVYVTLGDQWGLPIFANIAGSEQTHTDAVLVLLERYELSDPAVGNAIGVFTNSELQSLYDQLVAQGSQSLQAALTVGATIEDLDIVDLQTRLAQTTQVDIQTVYGNLMGGSSNHLRAFTTNLAQQSGVSYQPQYLDQATYASIVDGAMGRGR